MENQIVNFFSLRITLRSHVYVEGFSKSRFQEESKEVTAQYFWVVLDL
jgi:hypothetical protein